MTATPDLKWIAREIRLREGKQKYIGGGEESYGFLAEDFVRDKDAVSACCLIAEVAAWAKIMVNPCISCCWIST